MRHRAMALVIRDKKILMVKMDRWELPGGGIEDKETPGSACLRELKEECNLDGKLNRPLNTLYWEDGSVEYIYLVDVNKESTPSIGFDPEVEGEQYIKDVKFLSLEEIPERDRAFLFSYGILDIEEFRKTILSWGDKISYPID